MTLLYLLIMLCMLRVLQSCPGADAPIYKKISFSSEGACNRSDLADCKLFSESNFGIPLSVRDLEEDTILVKATLERNPNSASLRLWQRLAMSFLSRVVVTSNCTLFNKAGYCDELIVKLPVSTLDRIRQEEDFYFTISIRATDTVNGSQYADLGEIDVCLQGSKPTKIRVIYWNLLTSYRGLIDETTSMITIELLNPASQSEVAVAMIMAHDSYLFRRDNRSRFAVTWSIQPNSCTWLHVRLLEKVVNFEVLEISSHSRNKILEGMLEEDRREVCYIRFNLKCVRESTECASNMDFTVKVRLLEMDGLMKVNTEVKDSSCELRVSHIDDAGSTSNADFRVCFELAPNGVQCFGCSQLPDVGLHANGRKATIELVSEQVNWCLMEFCFFDVTVFAVNYQSRIPVICKMSFAQKANLTSSKTISSTFVHRAKPSRQSTCPGSTIFQTNMFPGQLFPELVLFSVNVNKLTKPLP